MSAETLLLVALGAPLARAIAALVLPRPPGLRDLLSIGLAIVHATAAVMLLNHVARGEIATIVLARPLPDMTFTLALEPIGAVVAACSGVLSVLHALHTAGFVRASQDPAPARLNVFVSLSVLMATGVASSANLFTLFVFHQALILVSLPLVAHASDEASRKAARLYLSLLMAAAIGLLLPAIVWTHALTGELTFRAGGLLAGKVGPFVANILLTLYVFGFATLALPPFHRWLSGASAAPFPAIGAIHAIAVAPAAGVALMKTTLYVFGPAIHQAGISSRILLVIAGLTMCIAALNALGKQDIRQRLAYSMIAQMGAVTAGAMMGAPASAFAAILQIVAQSFAALTLIMAFANVQAATGRLKVNEMHGLGRLMPWSFAGVAIGAVSLIGLPPLAGAWPKLWLMTASAEAMSSETGEHHALLWAGGLVALSVIATFAYLAPLAAQALVGHAPENPFRRPDRASIALVFPVVAASAATLSLIALVDPLFEFLLPLWSAVQ